MTGVDDRARINVLWVRALVPGAGELEPPRPDVPFSAAGGHSLAAARIVAGIRAELGRRVSIVEMLRADPTLDELAAMVAAAPPADADPTPVEDLTAARTHGRAPLSRQMLPVWAFHRLHPESAAYNVLRVLTIEGRVEPRPLRAAALAISERHDALRCCIREPRADHPRLIARPSVAPVIGVQVVQVPPDTTGGTTDWETCAPPAVDAALRDAADRPFDMATAPLWRLHVVFVPRLNRTWLLFATHHLIADLRASDVLLTDLAAEYRAARRGETEARPEAPSLIAYLSAEAEAETRPETAARRQEDLDWWAATLGQRPEARPLPLAVAPESDDSYAGDAQTVALDTPAVEELARRFRVTNATVLLAAVSAIFSSWRGVDAAAFIGVPSARPGVQGDDPVGFLVDTVPVRVVVAPERTFAELCRDVRDAYLDALAHAPVTIGDIMARLAIPRWSSRSTVLDLWFNDLEHARCPPRFGDAPVLEYDLAPSWALFLCGLYVRRSAAGLRLHGVVPRGTMRPDDLRALLCQIGDLVVRVAREPKRPVEELLAPPEVSTPRHPLTSAVSTVDRIEQIVAGSPDAVAVHCADEADGAVTFARLAADVRGRSAAWDTSCRVALGAEREYDHIANLIAVVASGASVALIDRSWPVERQRAAIRISGATHTARIDGEVLAGVELAPQAAGLGGIVIQFTSGSTGAPLAVATSDEVRLACIEDLGRWLGVRGDDRASFLSGAAHDPSWRDIDLPLRAGATVYVPPEQVQADPSRLVPWLRETRITLASATPPLLALALESAEDDLPDLRLLVVGGAPLPAALARRIREVAPQATVINGYGCTETPQLLTALRMEPGDQMPAGVDLTIGAPFPGRVAQVRTAAGTPCNVGQLGTVWASAPHIANGYLGLDTGHRPGVAAPFRTDSRGRRWFDTGDLARVDAAGNLRLAGRADRQRLVNGHRVMLDGIEAVARAEPNIAAAVAEAVNTSSAETLRLFVRPVKGAEVTETEVREKLRSLLPAAAVPARIIVTHDLLLNGNLKPLAPDLPIAASPPVRGAAPAVPPALAALAESILGGPLRATDNFFEAGFTSLTLLHFNAELSDLLQREIPAIMMFRYPSLQRLLPRLGVQAPGPARRAPPETATERSGVRDRRRQLRRSIARQLGSRDR